MNSTDLRNTGWALAISLSLLARPPVTLNQNQSSPQSAQQSQQDKDKKKKDQQNAKDNSQPAKDTKPADTSKSGDKPAPLFGGSLNIKSSRQSKDTATLGFNGVDDNGKVQQSFLSAAAGGSDAAAVQKMASQPVADADLNTFIQEGGLNTVAPPKKPATAGGKP